jgi:hypothetical protein
MNPSLSHHRADYVGITGSVLCLVHCLATPVLLVTANWLRDDTVREGFLNLDYAFILVNVVAVWTAAQRASRRIALALWVSLSLFAVGILFEDLNPAFEYLGYVASLSLIVSHFTNIRHCRH